MAYQRTDKDCKKVTNPAHVDVPGLVSCITYSIWNKDYNRTDKDCAPATQPKILQGWNEDYTRVFVDLPSDKPAEFQVLQKPPYNRTDVDNADKPLKCYIRSPLGDGLSGTIRQAGLVLTTEQRPEYIIQVEAGTGNMVLTFEPTTDLTNIDFTI